MIRGYVLRGDEIIFDSSIYLSKEIVLFCTGTYGNFWHLFLFKDKVIAIDNRQIDGLLKIDLASPTKGN